MSPRAQGAHDARSHLFTVRVWPEETEGRQLEWRGKIQHAANGETLYFRSWDSMLAFLRESLEPSMPKGEQVRGVEFRAREESTETGETDG